MEYKILAAGSLLLLLGMFIAPLITIPSYSITTNTISDLGSQENPNGWLINSIIIVTALSSVIAGWGYYEGFIFHRSILMLFGISLSLAAIFNQVSVVHSFQNNVNENIWHLYFTCTTLLSFVILTSATALIREREGERLLALATAVSVLALSILMYRSDKTDGIWNRLILLVVFGWMMYNFRKRE